MLLKVVNRITDTECDDAAAQDKYIDIPHLTL